MVRCVMSASRAAAAVKGAVVFLHGSGDNGANFRAAMSAEPLVRNLQARSVRFEFPSANPIRYTIAGHVESVWFDRLAMEPSSPEQTETVERSVEQVELVIDDLVASGVPPSRVAVGGFSMGGGLALQLALRTKHGLAGVFSLSSYMCDRAKALRELEDGRRGPAASVPRIWMAHGADDDFVLPSWGKATSEALGGLGVDVSWREYAGLGHSLRGADELADLEDFLCGQLGL